MANFFRLDLNVKKNAMEIGIWPFFQTRFKRKEKNAMEETANFLRIELNVNKNAIEKMAYGQFSRQD